MTADWETMEHASMGFDSSSDLFGGVLFGDELMDLYNPETHSRSGTDCTPSKTYIPCWSESNVVYVIVIVCLFHFEL